MDTIAIEAALSLTWECPNCGTLYIADPEKFIWEKRECHTCHTPFIVTAPEDHERDAPIPEGSSIN